MATFRDRAISVFKLKPKDPSDLQKAMDVVAGAYPRISKMINVMWGSRELHQKLTSMLQLDNVEREGFPAYVATALMTIHDFHMTEFNFDAFISSSFMPDSDRW